MRKIPTVFKRDPEDMRRVLPEVNPGCEWVLAGEGVATQKYDGTCVMFDGESWWARREVKPGKPAPDGFVPADHDIVTGKTVGWEPIGSSPFRKMHAEALIETQSVVAQNGWPPGTYELVGTKINGNPERVDGHNLWAHAGATRLIMPPTLDFRTCQRVVLDIAEHGAEGIVWHHPDGRMAKLKAKDFPRV